MGAKSTLSLRDAARLCAMEITIGFEDGGEEKLWVRTPTDAEKQEAHVARLDARAKARERYAEGTPARAEILLEIEDYPDYMLAGVVASAEMPALVEKARRNVPQPIEPDLTRFSDEAEAEATKEQHNQRVRDYEAKCLEELQRLRKEREEKLLAENNIDSMRERVMRVMINEMVNKAVEDFDIDYQIFHSYYQSDRDTRYFESISEVRGLVPAVKAHLLTTAGQVDYISPIEIKNSQGRSDQPTVPAESIQEPTQARSTPDSPASSSRKPSSRGGRKRSSTDSA